jgi:hypothetical protein
MALVLKDRVKETTTTTGTGTYTLAGAVTGFEAFSEVGDGNTTYYACTDGTDFEVGIGTYTASGTTLARTTILQSSNSDAAVNWSAGSKTIFITQPAEKAVFLNADGDIEFDNSHRIKLTSNGTDAVLDITGSGPNFIRFRDGTNFTDATNAVDIKYRTTPNDLLIERASGEIMAEFGGDDGHAALYFNDSKKLETLTGGVDITGNITVSGTVDGRDVAADGTKLDGIEANATADQTAAEIRTLVESATDSNVFTDADHTKLNGIEASADVTDTANVTAAGALMDSEVTNLADVKSFDPADYATAAQGTTADSAMQDLVDDTTPQLGGVLDTNGNNIEFPDSSGAEVNRLKFGAGPDLQIYHDGINSYISETGTGILYINSTPGGWIRVGSGDETSAYFKGNGAAELYYDNAKKLETTADGVDVTGQLDGDVIELAGGVTYDPPGTTGTDTATDVGLALQSGQRIVLGYDGYIRTIVDAQWGQPLEIGASGTSAFANTEIYGGSQGVKLFYNTSTKLQTTSDGAEILSTDDGAGNEPILSLYRHSASPADQDHAGTIQFNFQNDADQKVLGGRIYSEVDDVTDGSEDAAIKIAGLRGGSEQEYLELSFGLVQITGDSLFFPPGKTILFEGSTYDTAQTTLTVADPTADRTITLPDATGTVLTTGNSDTPTTTTSSSDADFVLVDDGGTMKKITPANLGITAGAASVDDATALAIALG